MNVVLMVIDTLRADHLGCYGYFRDTSPRIDRLAAEGIRFEDSYASGINTGTAFTGIHTGLYPIHHRVYNTTPPDLILDELPTMAETLRANGFTTAAFDNLAHNRGWVRDPVHFYRGFEYYISDVSRPQDWGSRGESVQAGWYNARMIPWIEQHAGEPFFIFAHYWDPHQPYMQPEPFRTRYRHTPGDRTDLEVREAPEGYHYVPGWGKEDELFEGYAVVREHRSPGSTPRREASIDLYDGAIAYVDQAIGEVVESLRKAEILDETLVVVTGDHGELLGQHGVYSHVHLYEGNIHVPLVVRYPSALPRGKQIRGLCGHVDLSPTILDLAGIKNPPPGDGMSLLPLIEGGEAREALFSEDGGGLRAIRMGDWKLILYCEDEGTELYNVVRDPMEVIDRTQEEPERAKELRERLDSWEAECLEEGEEDPVDYVVRHQKMSYRQRYDRLRIEHYGGGYVCANDSKAGSS